MLRYVIFFCIVVAQGAHAGTTKCTTTTINKADGSSSTTTTYACSGSVLACSNFTAKQKTQDDSEGMISTFTYAGDLPRDVIVSVGFQRFDPSVFDIVVHEDVFLKETEGGELVEDEDAAAQARPATVRVTRGDETILRGRVDPAAVNMFDPDLRLSVSVNQFFSATPQMPIAAGTIQLSNDSD